MSTQADGWTLVQDGYYSKGAYRIRRTSRGWHWWHVVQLHPGYPKGHTRTLAEAKDAVEQSRRKWPSRLDTAHVVRYT